MRTLLPLAALDPNLAALIVFACIVLFAILTAYGITITRSPKLLADFFRGTSKVIRDISKLFDR